MFLLTPEAKEAIKGLVKEAIQEANSHPTDQAEQVLNVPGVAALLHCTDDTVRDLAQAGKIPCSKPGKTYFFFKSEIFQWIKANRKTGIN